MKLDTIDLRGLVWVDELSHTGIISEVDRSLAGNLLIWEGDRQGRPITLAGKDDEGWLTRETMLQLGLLASEIRSLYTLEYGGGIYHVRFRHEEPPVLDGNPIVGRENQQATDYYNNVVIRLMEV